MMALRRGTLRSADFHGLVDPQRLSRINRSLRDRPFLGLVVACPYTPDLITDKSLDNAEPFASLLVDRLLPKIRQATHALCPSCPSGLDGISLGGRLSLLVALARLNAFGAVGSMQTGIEASEVKELSQRIAKAWQPGSARLRLLTSDQDFYREAVQSLHQSLSAASVEHDYLLTAGPHAYAFNRGPGAIEMLLWHDRVLRGFESI